MLLLFCIAWYSERSRLANKLINNPVIYVLSLGIYNSALTFYGFVMLAMQYGYGYLSIGLGFTGSFLLVPVLLYPILKLTHNYQLSSLADLFAFRFRSRCAGILTSLFMLVAMLPLIALQIKAVTQSAIILTGEVGTEIVGIVFCIILIVFSLLFGSKQLSIRDKRAGLIVAIAFSSFVKLLAFIVVAGYVLYSVFGGFSGLNNWLTNNQGALASLQVSLSDGPWRVLLLTFFASVVVMPHMFHMTFTENTSARNLVFASWGMPLYLLLISICVPIILWGGVAQKITIDPEYYILGIGLHNNNYWLSVFAYIGGLAAAAGVIIVSTIALSGMLVNHLVLPIYMPKAGVNIYRWLKLTRRLLVVAIILLGYFFYLLIKSGISNNEVGLSAFMGALQFFPGVLVLLYWQKGTKQGFIAGLLAGMTCWFIFMLLPLLTNIYQFSAPLLGTIKIPKENGWTFTVILSLSVNVLMVLLVSLITKQSKEEEEIASLCLVNATKITQRKELTLTSPQEFIQALQEPLGYEIAKKEVEKGLKELGFSLGERRSYALRRLRDQVEINLSGFMGPNVAQDIVNKYLCYESEQFIALNEDIYFMEDHLESYETRLTGLAAELDSLRRYHRLTLQTLPIGVCSISRGRDVLLWNRAMEQITGLLADKTVGGNLSLLDSVWRDLLITCLTSEDSRLYKQQVIVNGYSRWYNLHKAAISDSILTNSGGAVILVEDITDTYLLEDQLIHSERLASIGRLAAGVAHEIGNPVTGIACLAQILRDEWSDNEEIYEMSAQIIEQTKRISKIVHSLMSFAHAGGHIQSSTAVVVYDIVQETINLLVLNKEKKDIQFINLCSVDHQVLGNSQRLIQVLINLLDNARDASNDNDKVTINSIEYESSIEICIDDNGKGIPEIIQDRIFEPFFTTKDPGVGTGLGLSLVYSIIEDHHGKVSIKSPLNINVGTGTRFSIILPKYTHQAVV